MDDRNGSDSRRNRPAYLDLSRAQRHTYIVDLERILAEFSLTFTIHAIKDLLSLFCAALLLLSAAGCTICSTCTYSYYYYGWNLPEEQYCGAGTKCATSKMIS